VCERANIIFFNINSNNIIIIINALLSMETCVSGRWRVKF